MDYKLRWSDESVRNLEDILDYLKNKWTEKEIKKIKEKLNRQLNITIQNPYIFPVSNYNPRLRKAVLSKQTTIFYELRDEIIYLAYIHANKRDIGRIK